MSKSEKEERKRKTMYFCTFFGFCFTGIGFGIYKDIKTKGYYVDYKYKQIINGDAGLITAYVLLISGIILLIYSIYLLNKDNNK